MSKYAADSVLLPGEATNAMITMWKVFVAQLRWILFALVAAMAGLPLCGSVLNTTAVGFDPTTAHQVNEFDTVNTFNGQLMVNVPLGPVYKSNGSLQYQFMLGHNRDPWGFLMLTSIDTAGNTVDFFVVDRLHNFNAFQLAGGERWLYKIQTLTLEAPQDGGFGGTEAFPRRKRGDGVDHRSGDVQWRVID